MFRPAARTLTAPLFNTTSRRAFSSTPRALDVARLTLCGRVATEPEVHDAPNGTQFLKYSLATGFGRGETRRSTFWRIAVFDERQREIIGAIGKGAYLYVEGDVELKPYEDEAGKKHNYVNIFQRNVNVIFRPKSEQQQEGGEASSEQQMGENQHM